MTPGRRAWTDAEVAHLRALAPLGIVICRQELERSARSIYHKAAHLGLVVAPSPKGNHAGTRWRGKLPVPLHAHPIVRRIYVEANRQQATLTEIGERAGLDRHQLSRWGHSIDPRLSDVLAALNTLGLTVKIVRQQEEISHAAA